MDHDEREQLRTLLLDAVGKGPITDVDPRKISTPWCVLPGKAKTACHYVNYSRHLSWTVQNGDTQGTQVKKLRRAAHVTGAVADLA